MEEEQKRSPKWVQIGGLLLLLVVLPLGSFYYLKKGADFRREALAEFGDYGAMPDLKAYELILGQLPDSLRGNMFVLGWLTEVGAAAEANYGATLQRLGEQFKDSPHIYFVTLVQDAELGARFVDENDLAPYVGIQPIVRLDNPAFYRTAEDIDLPLSEYDAPGSRPIVALADSSLTVRHFYDLAQEDEVKRLVNHIALFIPLPEEKDILIDRKKEL